MTGHKTWRRLEEVTSDDLNGYLSDQVVARFPSVAARDAAFPTPDDGQHAWTPTSGLRIYRTDWAGWFPPVSVAWGLVAPIKALNQTVNAQAWLARWVGLTLYPGRAYELRAMVPLTTFGIPAAAVEFTCLGVIGQAASAPVSPQKFSETVPASGIVTVTPILPFSVATKTLFGQIGLYGAATGAKINGGAPGAVGIYDCGPLPTGPVPDAG
jgi:hypothetical protein